MPILFGRYDLGEPIGVGGSATVYRARDIAESRSVALKIVPQGPDANALRQRFLAEARALAKLRSKRIAALYDHGTDGTGGLYLALELVENPLPLEPKSFGRALLPHEVLRVARALLEGIAAAHEAGIVHLDIKPRNVLVSKDAGFENPKIVDFGISARIDESAATSTSELSGSRGLWGTIDYMPPEALSRGVVSPQWDIYACGLLLFELLGVGLLHSGATRDERLVARLAKDPQILGRVPDPLATALERMLARDEHDRFQSAREAFDYISDLDTAPVNSRGPMSEPPRRTMPPPPSLPVVSLSPATLANMSLSPETLAQEDFPPSSVRAPLFPRPKDEMPSVPAPSAVATQKPPARLFELDETPENALSNVIATLDMAMLDALARRERANATGRVVRATALTLRLDLDAAALLLEPLATSNVTGAMIGATLLAPRARRVTRARVDSARSDGWIAHVLPELAARCASAAVVLGARDEAERSRARCTEAALRCTAFPRDDVFIVNLKVAEITAAFTMGEKDAGDALHEIDDIIAGTVAEARAFDAIIRALSVGLVAQRIDPQRATRELRAALAVAASASCTLFEVRALGLLGAQLIDLAGHEEEGQKHLARAGALLSHGDLPTLLHAVEQGRGASHVMHGRYREAADRFRVARGAARAEVAVDLEATSVVNEIVAHAGAGQLKEAQEAASELSEAKLAMLFPRTQALAVVARALALMVSGDFDGALRECTRAKERVHAARIETSDIAFARIAVEALARAGKKVVFDEEDAILDLSELSTARGHAVLYWLDILAGAARGAKKESAAMTALMDRFRTRLLSTEDRKTSPPATA